MTDGGYRRQDRRATRRRPRTISSSCRRWSNRPSIPAEREREPRIADQDLRDPAIPDRAGVASGMTRIERSVTELTNLTLAEARDGLKAKRFSATELAQGPSSPRSSRRGRSTPTCWRRRSSALRAWRRPATRGSPRARRGRSKAFRSASRTCSAPRACAPPPARTSSTASRRPTNRPSRRICGATAR